MLSAKCAGIILTALLVLESAAEEDGRDLKTKLSVPEFRDRINVKDVVAIPPEKSLLVSVGAGAANRRAQGVTFWAWRYGDVLTISDNEVCVLTYMGFRPGGIIYLVRGLDRPGALEVMERSFVDAKLSSGDANSRYQLMDAGERVCVVEGARVIYLLEKSGFVKPGQSEAAKRTAFHGHSALAEGVYSFRDGAEIRLFSLGEVLRVDGATGAVAVSDVAETILREGLGARGYSIVLVDKRGRLRLALRVMTSQSSHSWKGPVLVAGSDGFLLSDGYPAGGSDPNAANAMAGWLADIIGQE